MVNLITEIKPINFKNKHGSLQQFIDLIKSTFEARVANQEATKLNPKRRRTKKKKNKDIQPIEEDIVNEIQPIKEEIVNEIVLKRTNLIPSTYLDAGLIEIYVKKQFKANYNEKLKERKKNKSKEPIINPVLMLSSEVVKHTVMKVDDMYASFFALKKNPPRHMNKKSIHPPHYLKDERFVMIFQKKAFKIESETIIGAKHEVIRYARLALGLAMRKKIKRMYPESKGFLRFKLPDNIKEKICEIEITPGRNKNDAYINFKYDKVLSNPAPLIQNTNDLKKSATKNFINEKDLSKNELANIAKKIMSIDLGIITLAMCVSLSLDSPLMYDGSVINHINYCYTRLIAKEQSKIKKINGKYTSKHINNLWSRREQKIRDQFEKITNDIFKHCTANGITEIIIGYNINWKNGVNMGHAMNDKFSKIPYKQFIDMLFYKGANKGINVKENEEAYTSKCDALSLESSRVSS